MTFESDIGDCTCPHCSDHRAVGKALDEHFAELDRNPPDPAKQAENRRRLAEAVRHFTYAGSDKKQSDDR